VAIDLVVLHSISLPPGEYGGDGIVRLFTNTLDWSAHPYYEGIRGLEVSAHFVIRRDGELLQFVSCDDRAWHAGRSAWQGRENCNDYAIGIELEGLEGQTFEAAQYDAWHGFCKRWRGPTRCAPSWGMSMSRRDASATPGRASTGRACLPA
jgi:AmpD protein